MNCPACNSDRIIRIETIPDHEYGSHYSGNYAACGECQGFYQYPMPTMAELASYYPDGYHSFSNKGMVASIRQDLRARRLKHFIKGKEPVLDYGCGNGIFLGTIAKNHPDIKFFGYEIGSEFKKLQRFNGQVTIIEGSMDELLEHLPACQLISMNHVIEHIPEPLLVLAKLCGNLIPGGVVEGQTPSADSLEYGVFKGAWSGFHAPRHTVVFSRLGLRTTLEKAGFERVSIEGAFNPAGIAVSLASLPQGYRPGYIKRKGLKWLLYLGVATVVAPIDLLSGSPGIINFSAQRRN